MNKISPNNIHKYVNDSVCTELGLAIGIRMDPEKVSWIIHGKTEPSEETKQKILDFFARRGDLPTLEMDELFPRLEEQEIPERGVSVEELRQSSKTKARTPAQREKKKEQK
jgi:hypothetical protein